MGGSFSQPTFDAGVWFNDAFFELAEEQQRRRSAPSNRVFSALETPPSNNNNNNNTNTIRQVERIRQRVERERERDEEQQRRQRNALQREQSVRDDAKRELDAQTQKQAALKREWLSLRAQALVDPRNAPFGVVQLLPFSNWRPHVTSASSDNGSSSPAEAVVAVADSGATAAIVVSRQDPALLAEVAALRDQVAEIEALRARLAEHSIVERGRSIARNAAREAEVQVDALASSWRSTVAGARSNDVLIDSLAAAVSSAESTAALDEQRRVRADAQCREVREELLAQLRTGDANRDISGLVRRYADCARNNSNQ